jgi:hypothetical protein
MMRTGVLGERVALAVAFAVAAGGRDQLAVAGGKDQSASPPSVQHGSELVHSALNPPFWSLRAYQTAWTQWRLKSRPADYAAAFRARYGLHVAPYENGGLPMGFTRPRGLLGLGHGLGNDCLLCMPERLPARPSSD